LTFELRALRSYEMLRVGNKGVLYARTRRLGVLAVITGLLVAGVGAARVVADISPSPGDGSPVSVGQSLAFAVFDSYSGNIPNGTTYAACSANLSSQAEGRVSIGPLGPGDGGTGWVTISSSCSGYNTWTFSGTVTVTVPDDAPSSVWASVAVQEIIPIVQLSNYTVNYNGNYHYPLASATTTTSTSTPTTATTSVSSTTMTAATTTTAVTGSTSTTSQPETTTQAATTTVTVAQTTTVTKTSTATVTSPTTTSSASRQAPPPRVLVSQVRGWIARSHSARPVKAWFVLTRRRAANEVLSGASVNSNQPVYVVVIEGAFTVPRPGPAAQGLMHVSVLNSVIDARTGRETDGGFGRSVPDLARLGKVRDLLPYLHHR